MQAVAKRPALPTDPEALKQAIRAEALTIGFDTVGFAHASLPPSVGEDLRGYLAADSHGTMSWMAETADRRADPRVLWPEVVSVIALGVSYAPGDDPFALHAHRDHGVISVYARNRDYHDLLKKRLKQLARWLHEASGEGVKVFVDTAPVMEKPLAVAAGLGWQGKHTNLVSRQHGSWLFLGEVFTTLPLDPDRVQRDHCGSCSACLDSCPTQALWITADGQRRIDGRRCIAYLTIEHQGPIARELRPLLGNRVYGCDDCVGVCPWNRFATPTRLDEFLPRVELLAPELRDLVALDDAAFREVFSGSPIKRIGRGRMVRNALVALGNSGQPALAAVVVPLLDDDDPMVRGCAVWALGRLAPQQLAERAPAALACEQDPLVREEWSHALCDSAEAVPAGARAAAGAPAGRDVGGTGC
ncbi:tRNA epoxyqueuosine(34) reductase QueG [Insolitispirillum peregrinum]|uniref:tRNA epoxyqueuosine(34) reductase QueG n=1 Tax=Insolitispirillum peregrinum TaxID=80876 RepID=UPI0036182427